MKYDYDGSQEREGFIPPKNYRKNNFMDFGNNDIKDGNYYAVLSYVSNLAYDDSYIILLMYRDDNLYKCYDESSKAFTQERDISILNPQYLIVDKKNRKIYLTYDIEKFNNKKREFNIKLEFKEPLMYHKPNFNKGEWLDINSDDFKYLENNCKKPYLSYKYYKLFNITQY